MKNSCIAASPTLASRPNVIRRLACLTSLAGALASQGAHAQSAVPDLPIAQALFEEARTLMTAGRYDEACAKLSESQHLDPASGTLLNLAVCHEKQGKTATAWAEYNDVLAITRKEGNLERQKIASQRIRELEPMLSHLSVSSPSEVVKRDLMIKLDGVQLGAAAWGMAIPVDPGVHFVEITAPGRKPWSGSVAVGSGGASSVVTVLALDPQENPAKRDTAGTGPAVAMSSERKRLAYILGASGTLVLGSGIFFGVRAKSEWDERNAHCVGGICDEEAVGASKRAHNFALAADGAFGLGLIGLGLGAYFALTRPSQPTTAAPPVAVSHAFGGTQLTLRGDF
jgi:hypothetical protein